MKYFLQVQGIVFFTTQKYTGCGKHISSNYGCYLSSQRIYENGLKVYQNKISLQIMPKIQGMCSTVQPEKFITPYIKPPFTRSSSSYLLIIHGIRIEFLLVTLGKLIMAQDGQH